MENVEMGVWIINIYMCGTRGVKYWEVVNSHVSKCNGEEWKNVKVGIYTVFES